MGLLIRTDADADHERLRELAAKAHWAYEPGLVRCWSDGLTFSPDRERWFAEVDGAAVACRALAWGADPNAVRFYERVGGRRLRDHVTEWGRCAPWIGVDL